jgi:putative hemolysin
MPAAITLANLVPHHKKNAFVGLMIKLMDRALGITHMDAIYQQNQMAGLSKDEFAQKLLDIMGIQVLGGDSLSSKIPQEGPLVIASNHPFGGIEGVILCLLLGRIRPDLKVLANQGLKLFPELQDYFIFTNPLTEKNPKNTPSIRASVRHVKQGGALLIFPAGRVSYYQNDKGRISEHSWNRVIGRLISSSGAHYIPIFISGENSPLFYRLGRIYYRLRMLMLPRELLNKKNQKIQLSAGNPVASNRFYKDIKLVQHAQLCRVMSYVQDPQWHKSWAPDKTTELLPLVAEADYAKIFNELDELPGQQHLLDHKQFSVFFGYQNQLPVTVAEIARLRELVFREHNEGSGQPLDTDSYDATYTHLFVVERKQRKIIGAYRMGQTDRLLQEQGMDGLYLSRMFNFKADFINQLEPCLEMGRSFLIPEYQRSFQGLYLLWRGIGAFACKFPHYRTLYGTVSLSKLYDMRSVSLMENALVTKTDKVKPKTPFDFKLHPELQEFAEQQPMQVHLSALLASIEDDGKDIPVLAKHYLKMGAKYHCLGIDSNFNDTPGLLLSVELPQAPEKLGKLYLADGWKDYKAYNG